MTCIHDTETGQRHQTAQKRVRGDNVGRMSSVMEERQQTGRHTVDGQIQRVLLVRRQLVHVYGLFFE